MALCASLVLFGRVHATTLQGSKASVLYCILPFEVRMYHPEHVVL
jgi:hypothetical protein